MSQNVVLWLHCHWYESSHHSSKSSWKLLTDVRVESVNSVRVKSLLVLSKEVLDSFTVFTSQHNLLWHGHFYESWKLKNYRISDDRLTYHFPSFRMNASLCRFLFHQIDCKSRKAQLTYTYEQSHCIHLSSWQPSYCRQLFGCHQLFLAENINLLKLLPTYFYIFFSIHAVVIEICNTIFYCTYSLINEFLKKSISGKCALEARHKLLSVACLHHSHRLPHLRCWLFRSFTSSWLGCSRAESHVWAHKFLFGEHILHLGHKIWNDGGDKDVACLVGFSGALADKALKGRFDLKLEIILPFFLQNLTHCIGSKFIPNEFSDLCSWCLTFVTNFLSL